MENTKQLQSPLDETPFYALLAIGLIFAVLVTAGWGAILNGEFNFSGIWQIIGLAGGLVIAGVAIMMAKAVAKERMKTKRLLKYNNFSTLAAYFFLLFILSSVGTMNTLYRFINQGTAVSTIVTTTIGQLNALESRAEVTLTTPKTEEKKVKVGDIRKDFEFELTNPINCGMGPVALKHFAILQSELPTLVRLSDVNTVNDCAKAKILKINYGEKIDNALDSFLSVNYPQERIKISKLEEIKEKVAEQIVQLAELKNDTAGIQSANVYQPALQKSWDVYQKYAAYVNSEYTRGSNNNSQLKGANLLPETIVNPDIQTLKENKGISILKILLKQWYSIDSLLIFVLAISLDLMICTAYLSHLKNDAELSVQSPSSTRNIEKSRIRDLHDEQSIS